MPYRPLVLSDNAMLPSLPAHRWRLSRQDLPVLWLLGRGVWAYERQKRFASLPDLVALFEPVPSRHRRLDVERTVWLVTGVLRRVYTRRYCLPRSLLLYRLFREAGLTARLHVGVRRSGDGLDGHAWVDLEGASVGESQDPRRAFSLTFSHPAAPPEEHRL